MLQKASVETLVQFVPITLKLKPRLVVSLCSLKLNWCEAVVMGGRCSVHCSACSGCCSSESVYMPPLGEDSTTIEDRQVV